MKLQEGIATGTQFEARYLLDGSLEVRAAVSIATYAPGEFRYDAERDELHVPLSKGQKMFKQPFGPPALHR
ncbi:MAG: hypothetical protein H0V97_09130 [Actinobacteria bacterium]|nr:hypothetical protein [Actinomycetota bacterium]